MRPVAGAALCTVAAALIAVSERRFSDLGAIIDDQIDWRGLPDSEGGVPRCHGRREALARIREGVVVGRQLAVTALVEDSERVLARVQPTRPDDLAADTEGDVVVERFVVLQTRNGKIVAMRAFAAEVDALAALHDR